MLRMSETKQTPANLFYNLAPQAVQASLEEEYLEEERKSLTEEETKN